VLSLGDLDHAPGPFVCTDCVAAQTTTGANGASPRPLTLELERLARPNEELARRLDDFERRLAAGAGEDHDRAKALETRLW